MSVPYCGRFALEVQTCRTLALAARSMLTCNKDRGWLPSRAQPERACDPGLGLIDT